MYFFGMERRVPVEGSINTTESHQINPQVPHRATYQKCEGYSLGHAAEGLEVISWKHCML